MFPTVALIICITLVQLLVWIILLILNIDGIRDLNTFKLPVYLNIP